MALLIRQCHRLPICFLTSDLQIVVKLTGYRDQAALERHLKELAKEAPDIASTFSLGQSEQVSIG